MRPLLPRSLCLSTRSRGLDSDGAAEIAALGADHPLVRLQCERRTTADQIRAVAVAQAVGVGALLQGTSWSFVLFGSATLVQLALGMRMLVLAESRHDLCRELIAGGGVRPDLPVVRREWSRLADPRHRARLACSLEEVARAAVRPWAGSPGSRLYFSVRLVRPLAAELREIAAQLRDDVAGVPGVAVAERLLTFPQSPLWGTDSRRLAEELARIRFLLVADRAMSSRE
jgi:hypothetical protein